MLSGGTNSKTTELAKLCEINYCGVAIGSYARKIVKRYISRSDFWSNSRVVEDALLLAKALVESVVLK
jgi:hypothetical protein